MSPGEVVPLEHAGHGHLASKAQTVSKAHAAEPFAVSADGSLGLVQDAEGLFEVGGRVGLHFIGSQLGAEGGTSAGVTNLSGVVSEGMLLAADDEGGNVRVLTPESDVAPGSVIR